ncbi:hypothetical protein EW145_g2685 [Phellinidium pouzarii]|uniref:Uncharacterized protein n=1 Tax=Phellinidium pouzarii TaxID=167371 RepID=A0A4S4LA70_9AGAM|nr:hypothetical protein EW145_g2685 [Phellinidium pouzarii]
MATVFSGTMVTVAATRSFLRLFQLSRTDSLRRSRWIADSDAGTLSEHDDYACSACNDSHMLVPGDDAAVDHDHDYAGCEISSSDAMQLEETRTKKKAMSQ